MPVINATLCYLRHEHKTLMLHRNKKPGDIHKDRWNGLGGKIEPGESPEECARREIFEESGLTAISLTLKGLLTFPLFDGVSDWQVCLFRVDRFTGELQPSPEGDLSWIPNDQLEKLNLWEGDRIFLKWLDMEGVFSGKFEYCGGVLREYSVVRI